MNDVLYLVLPCYNEEEVLGETSKRLFEKLQSLIKNKIVSDKSRIVFVDDGSKDKTWTIIEHLTEQDKHFSGVKLSRNRGHQNALLAGLMSVRGSCDVTISMDADLQDDIDAIDGFLEEFNKGNEVVYGVRNSRKTDTFFKRVTARGFYKFMKAMGVNIVYDHADYRLLSSRALEALSGYREVNLFLRGIVPLIGFRSSTVSYDRRERFAGVSKYPLKKMLSFAFDGITSFSVKPIKYLSWIGFFMFIVSLGVLIYALLVKLFGYTVDGWTALMASIWMIGGIQLLSLGMIGQYIGKIYSEVKQRPRYIIEKTANL